MMPKDQQRLSVRLPGMTLGLTTAAFIVAKTGRDALFFQGSGGLLQLPLVYISIGAASLPLALIFVKAMKIWVVGYFQITKVLSDSRTTGILKICQSA